MDKTVYKIQAARDPESNRIIVQSSDIEGVFCEGWTFEEFKKEAKNCLDSLIEFGDLNLKEPYEIQFEFVGDYVRSKDYVDILASYEDEFGDDDDDD